MLTKFGVSAIDREYTRRLELPSAFRRIPEIALSPNSYAGQPGPDAATLFVPAGFSPCWLPSGPSQCSSSLPSGPVAKYRLEAVLIPRMTSPTLRRVVRRRLHE